MLNFFFFFNDTATTEIYTLSLHDALPIYIRVRIRLRPQPTCSPGSVQHRQPGIRLRIERLDRKSTRLNSSHSQISYAVFCLKKKRRSPTARSSTTSSCLSCRLRCPV